MALPVTITGISTAVAPAGPFKVAAGSYSALSIDTAAAGGTGYQVQGGTASQASSGQSLTNGASALIISQIVIPMFRTGTPTDNVYCEITSTAPGGTVLATSGNVAASSITATTAATAGSVVFTFSSPPTISASAAFGVQVRRTGAQDTANYFGLSGTSSSSPYAGGIAYQQSGTTWSTSVGDIGVKVYGTATIASDSYYFFGRDGTTATTLQAYRSIVAGTLYSIVQTDNASNFFGNGTTTSRISQTFTTDASAVTVTSIAFTLRKVGAPTDNLVVDLQLVDTGTNLPTGAVLATSGTVVGSTLSTTVTSSPAFTFAVPVVVSPNTRYAVSLRRSASDNGTDYYNARGGSTPNVDSAQGSSFYNSTTPAWGGYRTEDVGLTVTGTSSAEPDVSWASIATKTGFTTAILQIAAYQVGNVIHMAVMDGTMSSSVATKYVSFDASTDTFLATTETVAAAQAITGQATSGWGCSLVVRSNGEAVAFYNGLQTKTSGTFRARCNYRRRTGVNTWSTETSVDGGTLGSDATFLLAVLGAADRVHFFWSQPAPSQGSTKTLSAANALSSTRFPAAAVVGDGVSYDRSGTTKVVVTTNVNGSQGTLRFNSSDDPTATVADQSIAAATIPHRIGVDTQTDDVTIVYRSSADSDLYAIKSTDDGATFGSPVSFFVGTVANADANASRSSSGSMYQRGTNIVIGYVVNDNGTLKYNEYTVATITADAWNVRDKSSNVDLTSSDRTATANSGAVGGVRSYQTRTNGTAGKYYWEYVLVGGTPNFGARALTENLSGASTDSFSVSYNGNLSVGTTTAATGLFTATAGDVICYAWDTGAEKLYVRLNTGNWNNNSTVNPGTGVNGADASAIAAVPLALAVNFDTTSEAVTLRTRVADLTVANKPSGYTSWMGEALSSVTHYSMPAATGAFAVVGPAVALRYTRVKLVAAAGAFAVAGQTVNQIKGYKPLAGVGAFALTGQGVVLARGMPVAAGAFTIAGQTAGLRKSYKLTADAGSFSLAGQAVALRCARKLIAEAGAVVVAGQDATLIKSTSVVHRTMPADAGAFALAGYAVTLKYADNQVMTGGIGAFALAGQTVTLRYTRVMSAAAGAFAVAGQTVAMRSARKLLAATGPFTVAGQTVALKYGRGVAAGTGTFTLAGQTVGLRAARKVVAAPGAFALIGQPVSLVYSGAGDKTLTAAIGTFAVSGQTAVLRATHRMTAEAGITSTIAINSLTGTGFGFGSTVQARWAQTFTTGSAVGISGVTVRLQKSNSPVDSLQVEIYATDGAGKPTGTVLGTSTTISGAALTTSFADRLFTFTTPVAVSGSTKYAAVISRTGALSAVNFYQAEGDSEVYSGGNCFITDANPTTWFDSGLDGYLIVWLKEDTFALAGQSVALRRARVPIVALAGSFAVAGQTAALRATHNLTAGTGSFAVGGQTVVLKVGMPVGTGTFAVNGQSVFLRYPKKLVAETGAFTVAAAPVNLVYSGAGDKLMPAAVGTFAVNGLPVAFRRTNVVILTKGTFVFQGITVTLTYVPTPPTIDAWDKTNKSASITLSNNDKTAVVNSSVVAVVRSTTRHTSGTTGKYYAEFSIVLKSGANLLALRNASLGLGTTSTGMGYNADTGAVTIDGSSATGVNIGSAVSGNVVSVAWDAGARKVWWRLNAGNWNANVSANPATGANGVDASVTLDVDHALEYFAATTGERCDVRTEIADFTIGSRPSGFTSWMGELLTNNVVMPVTVGAFGVSGKIATLRWAHKNIAATGPFALTGYAVTLKYADNAVITGGIGTFALTGQPVTFRYTRTMPAATGVFALTGQVVTLRNNRVLRAAQSSIIVNGVPADLIYTESALSGVNVWNGTGWVDKPAKVWAGSAWMQKPVKTWNGSAWV